MPVTPEELALLSDDVTRIRAISSSLHCEKCGYSLRTLPIVGRCPECGNLYNARHDRMEGIFGTQDVRLPLSKTFVAIIACIIVVYGAVIGFVEPDMWGFVLAGVFAPLAIVSVRMAYRGFGRYFDYRSTARSVALSREDE